MWLFSVFASNGHNSNAFHSHIYITLSSIQQLYEQQTPVVVDKSGVGVNCSE